MLTPSSIIELSDCRWPARFLKFAQSAVENDATRGPPKVGCLATGRPDDRVAARCPNRRKCAPDPNCPKTLSGLTLRGGVGTIRVWRFPWRFPGDFPMRTWTKHLTNFSLLTATAALLGAAVAGCDTDK